VDGVCLAKTVGTAVRRRVVAALARPGAKVTIGRLDGIHFHVIKMLSPNLGLEVIEGDVPGAVGDTRLHISALARTCGFEALEAHDAEERANGC